MYSIATENNAYFIKVAIHHKHTHTFKTLNTPRTATGTNFCSPFFNNVINEIFYFTQEAYIYNFAGDN